MHSFFYTSLLNHRATSSLPRELHSFFYTSFQYIQKFYKSHTKITLLNKETHKIFDSHKQSHCKNHTYRPKITSRKQLEAQEHPNLMVALPNQPYMCSSSYSQFKMPPRSTKIFNLHVVVVYQRERESFPEKMTSFRALKLRISPLLLKTQHI